MHMARGLGRYKVALAKGWTGVSAYRQLKRAVPQQLYDIGFPVPMKNRIALAFCGGWMGGRGHGPQDIPKHHLTADDFPQWNEDEFLAFVPPSGDAPEGRPRGLRTRRSVNGSAG